MSMTDDLERLDSVTRTSQIISGALITGVLVFLGVSIVVDPMGVAPRRADAGAGPGVEAGQGKVADAQAVPRAAAGSMEIGEILTWTAVAFAAMSLPLSFVVPRLVASQNRRSIAAGTWTPSTRGNAAASPSGPETLQSDTAKLAIVYQTQLIIGAATLEGSAFFAVLAHMLGKNPIALGLAFLLLGTLIVRFPTRLRIASWIDTQQELLIQERQSAV